MALIDAAPRKKGRKVLSLIFGFDLLGYLHPRVLCPDKHRHPAVQDHPGVKAQAKPGTSRNTKFCVVLFFIPTCPMGDASIRRAFTLSSNRFTEPGGRPWAKL